MLDVEGGGSIMTVGNRCCKNKSVHRWGYYGGWFHARAVLGVVGVSA